MWPEENNNSLMRLKWKLAGLMEEIASGRSITLKASDTDTLDAISRYIFKKNPNPEACMKLGSDKYTVKEVDCPEAFSNSVLGGEWLKGNTFLVVDQERGLYRVPKGTSPDILHKVPLTSLHSDKGTREAAWLRDQAKRAGLSVRAQYIFITVRVEQPRPQVQRLPFEDIPL